MTYLPPKPAVGRGSEMAAKCTLKESGLLTIRLVREDVIHKLKITRAGW